LVNVHLETHAPLPKVAGALNSLRAGTGPVQCRQYNANQNRDNPNNDKKLDEGESQAPHFFSRVNQ
jgi:hypothetical protein